DGETFAESGRAHRLRTDRVGQKFPEPYRYAGGGAALCTAVVLLRVKAAAAGLDPRTRTRNRRHWPEAGFRLSESGKCADRILHIFVQHRCLCRMAARRE